MSPRKKVNGKADDPQASTSKSTRSAKYKYPNITAHTQTLTHEHSSDEETTAPDANQVFGAPVPSHLLQSLIGNGQATTGAMKMNIKHPIFSGQSDKFQNFRNKLDNWLLINGVYNILNELEPEAGSNLALYLFISVCLEGEPFQLVSGSAKGNGQ